MSAPLTYRHNVGAIMRRGDCLLLVREIGADTERWVLPGGRVEPGETLIDALLREVLEETGLCILELGALAYACQLNVPAESLQSTSYVLEVNRYEGEIAVDDPDGIAVGAEFVPISDAIDRLGLQCERMARPMVAYLSGRAAAGSIWYFERGDDTDQFIGCFPSAGAIAGAA